MWFLFAEEETNPGKQTAGESHTPPRFDLEFFKYYPGENKDKNNYSDDDEKALKHSGSPRFA
jgi:hypothetical protein